MPPTQSLNRKLWVRLAVLIVGVIGSGGALWYASVVPEVRTEIGAPEIVGSSRFCAQVHEALSLLKGRDADADAIVVKYVGQIREGEHSGMWAYETPPVYEMSDTTAFYSLTWCAATIAHDSFHSKLYHDYLEANGAPVPDAVWTGKTIEGECMKYQIAVMKRIGSSHWEVDHA